VAYSPALSYHSSEDRQERNRRSRNSKCNFGLQRPTLRWLPGRSRLAAQRRRGLAREPRICILEPVGKPDWAPLDVNFNPLHGTAGAKTNRFELAAVISVHLAARKGLLANQP